MSTASRHSDVHIAKWLKASFSFTSYRVFVSVHIVVWLIKGGEQRVGYVFENWDIRLVSSEIFCSIFDE